MDQLSHYNGYDALYKKPPASYFGNLYQRHLKRIQTKLWKLQGCVINVNMKEHNI